MTDKTNKVGEVLRTLPEVGDVVEMIPNEYYCTRIGERFTIESKERQRRDSSYVMGNDGEDSSMSYWRIWDYELGAYKLVKKAGNVEESRDTKTIEVEYVPGDKVVYMGEEDYESPLVKGGVYEVEIVTVYEDKTLTYVLIDGTYGHSVDLDDFRPLSDDDVIFKFDGKEY